VPSPISAEMRLAGGRAGAGGGRNFG
jgi:hypothetical protein